MAGIPADAIWRKSSRSATVANCVEVATAHSTVAIRDSKDRNGPMLSFPPDVWAVFLGGVKDGNFDLPTE